METPTVQIPDPVRGYEQKAAQLPPVLSEKTYAIEIGGKNFRFHYRILRPFTHTWYDFPSGKYTPITDTVLRNTAAFIMAPQKTQVVDGALIGYKESGQEVELDLCISATNDHELLFGAIKEAGLPDEVIRNAGTYGIDFPYATDRKTKLILLTEHFSGCHDRYVSYCRMPPENQQSLKLLMQKSSNLAALIHTYDLEIAREISGNDRIGGEYQYKFIRKQLQ